MAIIKREIDVAKEADDVMIFVVELVKDIKAKKAVGEIVSGSLNNLITAIDGVAGVKEEIAANREVVVETVGYRSGELINALIG